MATEPLTPAFSLDIREQLARIDRTQAEVDKWRIEMAKSAAEAEKLRVDALKAAAEVDKVRVDALKAAAETDKLRVDIRIAPWAAVFTGLGAGAALFAAGAAFTKLFLG